MLKKYDWVLMSVTLLLTVIGLVVLHAINFRDPSLAPGFNPSIQIIAAVLGLIAMAAMARMDYRSLARIAPFWYITGLLLLVAVLAVGETVSGATRSIDLGLIEFQPTEIAKLGLILLLARYYTNHRYELGRLKYLAGSLLLLAGVAVLVIMQPDLGSVVVIGAVWFLMTLMSPLRRGYIVLLLLIGLAAAPVAIQFLEPYQQDRIETFLNPTADPQGEGYNVNQAMIAVGSGQLFGRGLGGGTQSTLNFLPSQHTDFIFAVLAEKLGLVGAGVVVLLFGVLLWRAIRIAWRAQDLFATQLATGITAVLLIQIVVTIGMSLGLAPVTGLPLPFIAYGGTNLIISLFSVGVLQSIAAHDKQLQFRE